MLILIIQWPLEKRLTLIIMDLLYLMVLQSEYLRKKIILQLSRQKTV